MKKIIYLGILLILVMLPASAMAGSMTGSGVVVTFPDSYESCTPEDTVIVDHVPEGYKTSYSVAFDGGAPAVTGDLFGSRVVIPIPYSDSSSWINNRTDVKVFIQIIRISDRQLLQLFKPEWTVKCYPPPMIQVTKTADPVQVFEPGEEVEFTVVIENLSHPTDPVTITSLVDDIHGDLNGQGTCSVPQLIQPGESYTCVFTALVSGNAGDSETDTVTASGTDDEGTPVSDDDDATVDVVGVPPVIEVTKTADPVQVFEPGEEVEFTVVIENLSNPTDPVTITSLVDDVHGDLNGQGTCSVPQLIQPGESYTCVFTATVSGVAGESETDTVTASGTDDEGTPVSDEDDATVEIIAREYKVYLPGMGFGTPYNCGLVGRAGVTIGFEDLPFSVYHDYDYNDWIVDVEAFIFKSECNLENIDFKFTPQARGARLDHAWHMLFPANTFASDGTVTFNVYDQFGTLISTEVTAFDASVDEDFLITPSTAAVFPEPANTIELQPHVDPLFTYSLSLEFSNPEPFDFDLPQLEDPHGADLFFDPWFQVLNFPGWDGIVHQGQTKMLAVPETEYLWPEERHGVFQAYEGVHFVDTNPPDVLFDNYWWTSQHNECVYGDGIVCPLPPILPPAWLWWAVP